MGITAIGTDYIASSGQSTSSTSSTNFFDYLALGTSAATPAVAESLAYAGYDSAAAISAATGNAMYGSAVAAAGGSPYYSTTGSLGTSYSSAYYTGGGLYSGTDGTSSTDLTSSVEDILTETATSQAYLIGIQAQLGQQQSTFTAVSNALNTKHSMERSAIQNFRS